MKRLKAWEQTCTVHIALVLPGERYLGSYYSLLDTYSQPEVTVAYSGVSVQVS